MSRNPVHVFPRTPNCELGIVHMNMPFLEIKPFSGIDDVRNYSFPVHNLESMKNREPVDS